MQKPSRLLLATLALLGTSAVFAQSSVTLYGRINTTVERQKDGGVSTTGMFNNASRWGVRGTEDLGGGLKAGFQLESGFASDTGTGTGWPGLATVGNGLNFGRQSEVNLAGGFGMVRLGNFVPESYYATADYVSMHNHDTGSSADAFYVSTFTKANKVGYMSPSWGGFQLHASVAEGSADVERTYDLAANFDQGALHLGAGFEKQGDFKQFAVRGLYEFGAFTVGGYVQRVSNYVKTYSDGSSLDLGSGTGFRIATVYTLRQHEFHANIGSAPEFDNLDKSDALQLTLAYNYNLSKRTKIHAFVTRVDRDDVLEVYGGNFDSFGLGVRHNF